MQFTKKLREGVRLGNITTSIRVWQSPRVKAGGRYPIDGGHVVVTSIREIDWGDISDSLARESGFRNLADLMETARHGRGHKLYFICFHFEHAASIG
ncbi:MAG: ASCH domain-containing protein [Rubrivivax sp.]|nr:MAG: ASCH domain-containing protein [Rubrivivax sp.]